MTFAVTGFKARVPEIVVFDTIEEAMSRAESWLKANYVDVAVWKQAGIPTLKSIVEWEKTDK